MKNQHKIPDDWKLVRLGADIKLITGSRPIGGAVDDGIPSLGGEHITEDGKINFNKENAKFIPKNYFKFVSHAQIKPFDILINKDGAQTGKLAIVKPNLLKLAVINEHLFILRSQKLWEQKFLFYYLSSKFVQERIKLLITGSAQPGLNSKFVNYLSIPLPPLSEQRKIAEILETIDNLIDTSAKTIEKLRGIKQGLMNDLLSYGIDLKTNKIRNPKTHNFIPSPLGPIPENWKVKKLGELGKIITGATPPTEKAKIYFGDEYLFITPEDITDDAVFIYETKRKLSKNGFKLLKNRIIPPNSICVVCIASLGKICVNQNEAFTNQQINSLILKGTNNFLALFYLISFFVPKQLKILAGLQAVPIVNKEKFSKILIPVPPLEEQERIAEILQQADKAIETEQAWHNKLQNLKKALMQDLLTGKVRVTKLLNQNL